MLKRVALSLLIISLCSLPQISVAGWGAVGACFTDPCNCGDKNKKRYETWDGERINKGKKNRNCPPYNKSSGRKDNTCLVQKNYKYPGKFTGYYQKICGEAVSNNNYFKPKIRVRNQQCNAAVCWTGMEILENNGDCVTFPGPYLFPLVRICARVAVAASTEHGLSADPGYTEGEHLDKEGATQEDTPIYDSDHNEVQVATPKLCLYNDPSFFSISADGIDMDFMDLNPSRQPLHKTKETHPVIAIFIFFAEVMEFYYSTPATIMAMIFDLISGADEDIEEGFTILKEIMLFIVDIIKIIGDAIVWLLKEVGQMNRVVNDTEYGCVDLPMGPLPCPYCETVVPFAQDASIYNICPKDTESTRDKECVVSKINNNFIHNAIRVGYDTFMPLCTGDENPMTSDSCVTIENLGVFNSAQALHALTDSTDLIKPCSNSTSEPCIKSMLSFSCSADNNDCKDGFRVVYGSQVTQQGGLDAKRYFDSEMDDCTGSLTSNCQKIWGVNRGEFRDISLTFPEAQSFSDMSALSTNFSLVDKYGKAAEFYASIVREANDVQEPTQICVFNDENKDIGCAARVAAPALNIFSDSGNSYFFPKLKASYSINGYSTSAPIEPLSVYNTDMAVNSVVNLAGNEIEAFVTDEQLLSKPFSGTSSPNPASIFGVYTDDASPIIDGEVNDDAEYLRGLEYINGEYHLGGKFVCAEEVGITGCPANPEMCVLTKRLNNGVVKCSDFDAIMTANPSLVQCTGNETGCSVSSISIPKIGGGSITINSCTSDTTDDTSDDVLCYDSTVELCTTSYDTANRVDPSSDKGDILSSSQYYDKENYRTDNDMDNQIMRSKTSLERGLCLSILQPDCSELNVDSADNGHASWPKTPVGEVATGTCYSGYQSRPGRPATRNCIAYPGDQSIEFGAVLSSCAIAFCEAERYPSEDNGYATWTESIYEADAIGTCKAGYQSTNTLRRPCNQILANGNGKLGSITSGLCEPIYCPAETHRGAEWPKTMPGEFAQGTCEKGKHRTSKLLQRECIIHPDGNSTYWGNDRGRCK